MIYLRDHAYEDAIAFYEEGNDLMAWFLLLWHTSPVEFSPIRYG
jgi:hypothetical protein